MLTIVGNIFFIHCEAGMADQGLNNPESVTSVSYSTWIKKQDTLNPSAKERRPTTLTTKEQPALVPKDKAEESIPYINSASKILEAEQRDIAKTEQALNEQKSKIAIIKSGIEYANSLNLKIEELNRQLQATKSDLTTTQEVAVKADRKNQELVQVVEVNKDLGKSLESEKTKNAAIRKQLDLLSAMMQEQADAETANLKREINSLQTRKEKVQSVIGK
jgi:chromosome segregation ATPase